jgi:hypothetical protein
LAHETQHIYQANHNESFLNNIDTSYIDWKFIVLYYAALHFGDAFVAKKRKYGTINFDNHEERKRTYLQYFDLNTFKSYQRLEDYSRTARYHPEGNYVLTEDVFRKTFTEDFLKIKGLY